MEHGDELKTLMQRQIDRYRLGLGGPELGGDPVEIILQQNEINLDGGLIGR